MKWSFNSDNNQGNTFPAVGVVWEAWVRAINAGIARGIWSIARVRQRCVAMVVLIK